MVDESRSFMEATCQYQDRQDRNEEALVYRGSKLNPSRPVKRVSASCGLKKGSIDPTLYQVKSNICLRC